MSAYLTNPVALWCLVLLHCIGIATLVDGVLEKQASQRAGKIIKALIILCLAWIVAGFSAWMQGQKAQALSVGKGIGVRPTRRWRSGLVCSNGRPAFQGRQTQALRSSVGHVATAEDDDLSGVAKATQEPDRATM